MLSTCDTECIRENCNQTTIITDGLGSAIITWDKTLLEQNPTGLASIDNNLYLVGTQDAILYGLNTTSTNSLWTQLTTTKGYGINETQPTGLASIDNTLYMVGHDNATLYASENTIVWTEIASTHPETKPTGLTNIGTTLYMVGLNNAILYSLDTTETEPTWEQITTVKGFGIDETQPTGLASVNNELYLVGTQTDTIAKINIETGIAEIIGNAFRFGKKETMPQDMTSIGETIYMIGQTNNYIYRINYNNNTDIHYEYTCFSGTPHEGSTTNTEEIRNCESCNDNRILNNDNECETIINARFARHENGVTITCDDAELGDRTRLSGIEYTKRDNSEGYEITTENAATTCISGVTDLSNLFSAEEAINKTNFNGDISHWDTSDVTTMEQTFMDATNFNQNIEHWDTGNVTTMHRMFQKAKMFNQDIGNWNTENLTNARSMFENALAFNQDLTEWCVPKITNALNWETFASATFQEENHPRWGGCNGFYPILRGDPAEQGPTIICDDAAEGDTQILNIPEESTEYTKAKQEDLTVEALATRETGTKKLCTSGITNMEELFKDENAINFTIEHWDTKDVTTMKNMFRNAENFNRDIGHWNTANVENMEGMFYKEKERSQFKFNQNINNWDTGMVTTMKDMFRGTISFNQPLNNWNTINVTDMSNMFTDTTTFNQPLNNWNTENVANMNYMFTNATAFNQNISGWNVNSITTRPTEFSTGSALTAANSPTFPPLIID